MTVFIKPKNSKQRLRTLALYILNYLRKELYIDGQEGALLLSQLNEPVRVLQAVAEILKRQQIDTLKDFDIAATEKEKSTSNKKEEI